MSKTLNEAINILDKLSENDQLSLTQIASITDMNKSSVYRLLTALMQNELVDKDKNTKMYRLSLGLLRYRPTLLNSRNLVLLAKPFLAEIVAATGESVQLSVPTHRNSILTVDIQNSRGFINLSESIGTEDPLHCTAIGKSYLAFLDSHQRDVIIDQIELKRYTINTIVTKKDLICELDKIKEKGYAFDEQEIIEGIRCVASPVLDYINYPIASIGITGPSSRINISDMERYGEIIKDIASRLSQRLNCPTNNKNNNSNI
jgi:IclR family transcriptional regulator, KDG regulon repressor